MLISVGSSTGSFLNLLYMQKAFLRIPYTGPLPPPIILPRNANTPIGAIHALSNFLSAPNQENPLLTRRSAPKTVLLTGAGISVGSGLADYRGRAGTYILNQQYRPIYYHEFISSHGARKRYWARSFLGWTNLHRAKPNAAHWAVKDLGELGFISSVITQSSSAMHQGYIHSSFADDDWSVDVDSLHPIAHPGLKSLELHGYLRSLICIHCHHLFPRTEFQKSLAFLNPAWATYLAEMLEAGALDTENPDERRKKGLKTNPDGDVDLPNAPYSTFRYPACPTCLGKPLILPDGTKSQVKVDRDGAWASTSTAGVLKPAVTMFGESIPENIKTAAEEAIDNANRILVIGSSLATYSAWRLVKRAKERKMPIAILNVGGVRGEESFFADIRLGNDGTSGVRCSESVEKLLPGVVEKLRRIEVGRVNVGNGAVSQA